MARISEKDLVIPTLRAASRQPGGEIAMTKLEAMEAEFEPDGKDAEIVDGRRDTYFSQKVRNLVSHRSTSTSMFTRGYADYIASGESIRITDLGRNFLDQVPE